MKTTLFIAPLFLICLTMFSSCGGDTSITVQTPQQPHQPTTAILTLSSTVTGTIPAGTTINSYVVSVTLPEGVTVRTMLNSPATAAGVVVASGKAAGALIDGVYTAPSGSAPGSVKIFVASATGFDAGEFCIVHGEVSPGHYPSASGIAPPTLEDAMGFVGNSTVTGLESELSVTVSAVIQ